MLKKVIRIPEEVNGIDVEISKYQELIDDPNFQRLRWIKNCDLLFLIFPGMTVTRYEHSVGVLDQMSGIIKGIGKEESAYKFNDDEKTTLGASALYHDIGHCAFSHAIEQVLMAHGEPNHDQKCLEKIEMMQEKIKKVPNLKFSLLQEIFRRESAFSQMIWDSHVGADRLDYISRDAASAGIKVASDSERIRAYAYFDGKTYGTETKVIRPVTLHVNSWLNMYSEVYLRKPATILKGLLRTGFNELAEDNKIKLENVWDMTDGELLAEMNRSDGLAKAVYKKIRNRDIPKTFLTVKISGCEGEEEIRGKPIYVYGTSEQNLGKMSGYFGNVENVMDFQRRVEKSLGFERGDITVAEMPHIKHIIPKDTNLYSKTDGWTTLFNKEPLYKQLFENTAKKIYALRIAVSPGLRKGAYDQAQHVIGMLDSIV